MNFHVFYPRSLSFFKFNNLFIQLFYFIIISLFGYLGLMFSKPRAYDRPNVSHPKFAKDHLQVSPTSRHVLYLGLTRSPQKYGFNALTFSSATTTATQQLEYSLNNQKNSWYDTMVGSCHDIVCIWTFQKSIVLWNTSIRIPN